MSSPSFPVSLSEVQDWPRSFGVSVTESRLRFVQYVVLEGIASSIHAPSLVFKGGNALRFIYANQRSTIDLDFSSEPGFLDDADAIKQFLNSALGPIAQRFGIRVRCQKVTRNPKKGVATFATFQSTIGFAFPTDRSFANFEVDLRPLPTVVELEISLNEQICESVMHKLTPNSLGTLRVCSLEDIVAEKLRSLLQQPIRNRTRKQDVLDIATVWAIHAENLNREHIAQFLLEKSKARNVPVRKSAFNDTIRSRAMIDYDQLKTDAGSSFIPFEIAWLTILKIVDGLNIAE